MLAKKNDDFRFEVFVQRFHGSPLSSPVQRGINTGYHHKFSNRFNAEKQGGFGLLFLCCSEGECYNKKDVLLSNAEDRRLCLSVSRNTLFAVLQSSI